MWHTLKHVAENQMLDPVEFEIFALANASKFSLDDTNMVSTFHVDALLKAYRERYTPEAIKDLLHVDSYLGEPMKPQAVADGVVALLTAPPERVTMETIKAGALSTVFKIDDKPVPDAVVKQALQEYLERKH